MDFTKIFSAAQQVFSRVKNVTDTALDNVIMQAVHTAQERLDTFNKKWRVDFLRTFCLDMVFIAAAAVCIAMSVPWTQAFPIICGAGAAKLMWTFWRMSTLYVNLKPHKEIILRFAPGTLRELCHTRSLNQTLKSAVRNVVRYYYGEKLSGSVKTIHGIAAYLGAVSSAEDVENKIADAVYPPLSRYLRRILLVDVLCFTVSYGIFISLTKMYLMNYIRT